MDAAEFAARERGAAVVGLGAGLYGDCGVSGDEGRRDERVGPLEVEDAGGETTLATLRAGYVDANRAAPPQT